MPPAKRSERRSPQDDAVRLGWTHDDACPCRGNADARLHRGWMARSEAVVWKVLRDEVEARALFDTYQALGAAREAFCEPLGWDGGGDGLPPLVGYRAWLGDLTERATGPDAEIADLDLARTIAALVARVHAEGRVHGDLTPGNVLLDDLRDGRHGRGLPPRLTDPAAPEGTVAWRPPWRTPGAPPSREDDEYALAWLLVSLLLPGAAPDGAHPTSDDELARLRERWRPLLDDDTHDALEQWVRRAQRTLKHPDARVSASAAELAAILDRALASESPPPRPTPSPGPAPSPGPTPSSRAARRHHPGVLVAALACWAQCAGPDGPPVDVYVAGQRGVWVGSALGSEGQTAGDDDEEPRRVDVAPFLLSATEVSQAEWATHMGESSGVHSTADSTGLCGSSRGVALTGPRLPAVCVTWTDAVIFANRRSAAERLTPAYYSDEACTVPFEADAPRSAMTWWRLDAEGYRLPTEIEWEVAARAGGVHDHLLGPPNGDEDANPCAYENLGERGEADALAPPLGCDDHIAGLAPVDVGTPNMLGVLHLGGNVAEWTWTTDPRRGWMPELRGGTWQSSTHERIANRMWDYASTRLPVVGMRLARGRVSDTPTCVREATPWAGLIDPRE